jgi:hypothetical protein
MPNYANPSFREQALTILNCTFTYITLNLNGPAAFILCPVRGKRLIHTASITIYLHLRTRQGRGIAKSLGRSANCSTRLNLICLTALIGEAREMKTWELTARLYDVSSHVEYFIHEILAVVRVDSLRSKYLLVCWCSRCPEFICRAKYPACEQYLNFRQIAAGWRSSYATCDAIVMRKVQMI